MFSPSGVSFLPSEFPSCPQGSFLPSGALEEAFGPGKSWTMQSDAAAMPSYLQQTRPFAVRSSRHLRKLSPTSAECVDAIAQRQQRSG